MTFNDLGLSKETVQAIEELGILRPTTVQADVIPSVLEGKDIFTIAPQRSGKTYSYVFPLIDMIAKKTKQNILVITADPAQANNVSDSFAVFNKYHPSDEDDANVIIATPNLILELDAEQKLDLEHTDVLVVDDINLIKKKHQLANLEIILEKLPSNKQNIVFTNRRSKETQSILDKILKTPTEIKVDRTKEDEAQMAKETLAEGENKAPKPFVAQTAEFDSEALEYVQKFHVFGDKTPHFLLIKGALKRY